MIPDPDSSRPAGDEGEPAPVGSADADAGVREPAAAKPVRVVHRIDPWAHRRAEPRTFAFIWTLYLFVGTLITYAVAMSSGIGGHDVIRPAARLLLAVVAAGIVVVWPMVRLSQQPDPRPVAGPILDTVVVLVPVHAIVWPQGAWWLAGWPLPVVAAMSASLTCWAILVGGVLSISHRRPPGRPVRGAVWMGAILAAMVAVHVPAMLGSGASAGAGEAYVVRGMWMLSPVLSVFEVTQDRTWIGSPALVFGGHWRLIGLTGGVAVGVWLVAAALHIRGAGRGRVRGLH